MVGNGTKRAHGERYSYISSARSANYGQYPIVEWDESHYRIWLRWRVR